MGGVLVVDSGASRCKPLLLSSGGAAEVWDGAELPGLSPLGSTVEEMVSAWGSCPLFGRGVERVYVYGAGCVGGAADERMRVAMRAMTGCESVEVSSDLVGACRGAAGRRRGIVCILGTGMNSCLWDGERSVRHVAPLGYLLGDEGSGADLGRCVLRRVLRGADEDLRGLAFALAGVSSEGELLARLYGEAHPNRWLARFARLAADERLCDVVRGRFAALADEVLARYEGERDVYAVGGVAAGFERQLREALEARGFALREVCADPLPGLARWHG